ncbi:hypothetical protein SLNSH_22710 [Alsobacter soli]|uniref:Uncharacterized protein n=1 Tax=Alsobacter soli TaxID=2109933 RepID=A0A2T1HM06_9HYPH|nr:hypothetical protein SLNSH_22710 [Alsobacter soli]
MGMAINACPSCTKQFGLKSLDHPHGRLDEIMTVNFGTGIRRWSETTYVCTDCGTIIVHTSSKAHVGPSWWRDLG